jgi:hypothetical protein
MKQLLAKLNYRGSKRIAVINAEKEFCNSLASELKDVTIDTEIDPRFPYDFIVVFVRNSAEAEAYIPMVLHNLLCDGILWFCYPKKSSRKFRSDIDRDHGWKSLNDADFHGIRMVSIDNDWSGLRFRSSRFIKSSAAGNARK